MSTTDTQRIFLPFPATRSKHNFNIRHLIALSSFRQISTSPRCAGSGCAFWQATRARLLLSSFQASMCKQSQPGATAFCLPASSPGTVRFGLFSHPPQIMVLQPAARQHRGPLLLQPLDRHTGSRYGYDGVFPRHVAAATSYLLYWLASPVHRRHPAGHILASD
ncbi:Uncharacterised protein [Klebsiella quasipneumoniae]|nr:Uncharacterised protein [Klebsiella quasipneumoniae]